MRITKEFKNNKGITLVSLIITIVVMVIISSVTLYTSMDRFEINNLEKLYNDLELLSDKVSNYYLKYNGLPILRDETSNEIIKYPYSKLEFEKNEADNENYYIIDLEAIGGLSLSYGREGFESPNTSDDVFIINEKTHQIYYVKGIELDGIMYYTILDETSNIEDTIPPTKPEIKIISGELNNSKTEYITEVQIEIVPGKDKLSGVTGTTYICKFTDKEGNTEQILNENITENKIIKLENNGTYEFTVTTTDTNNNTSNIVKTINTNIQRQTTFKLADAIIPDNYGDVIEYEANGVKDWKVFFNDGDNVFIITSDYIPSTSLPSTAKMTCYNTYNIYWPNENSFVEITENSKILDRAEKFKISCLKDKNENTDINIKATRDLLNNNIWSEFATGLVGAQAIGSSTLEMFIESWNQKGYRKIEYSYNEDGYSIGPEGLYLGLWDTPGYQDLLYFPHPYKVSEEAKVWIDTYKCYSYWLASPSIQEARGNLMIISEDEGSMQTDWYSANYIGLRPVVCLPSNAVATLKDGVWTNLTVD